jgi:LuxR family transcriptional regulator, maltose regulon positive regulatory protein
MATRKVTDARQDPLRRGWEQLDRLDWPEARASFEQALSEHTTAEGLEGLGLAAWWLDDAAVMFEAREHAYRLYRRRGDRLAAGRMATLLGIDNYQFRGDAAIGNGWFGRAHRLLDELAPAPEHGWLAIWEGQIALQARNDPEAARIRGAQAAELGGSLGLVDLEMTGLGLEGLALVAQGDTAAGMTRLDEATAAAVGGEMSIPNAVGATCCYLIFACERVRDYDRAVQWCRRVQEYCTRVGWASLFATCRTHHASVLMWQGAWAEAEAELELAIRELEATRPGDVVHGVVRLAELRRRQGRLDEAARLLSRIDFDPHALLGLAAVALDRDRPGEASGLVDRALRRLPRDDRTDRAAALELAVRASVAAGDIERGRRAVLELQEVARLVGTDPIRASAAVARGLLAAAAGELEEGLDAFEDALAVFERTRVPFEAAMVRFQLARVLMALGRAERAAVEAHRAHDAFMSIGATREMRRTSALLRQLGERPDSRSAGETSFGLSARELEVLALVADGLSNKRIAAALVISEHTVRRHVANILGKLHVASRTAAATVAARHGLL